MGLIVVDVVCQQGHQEERMLKRNEEGYPIFEPCRAGGCGLETKKMYKRIPAFNAAWADGEIQGADPVTGEFISMKSEDDIRAYQARVRDFNEDPGMIVNVLSPSEQRRARDEGYHRAEQARRRLGMPKPKVEWGSRG